MRLSQIMKYAIFFSNEEINLHCYSVSPPEMNANFFGIVELFIVIYFKFKYLKYKETKTDENGPQNELFNVHFILTRRK